jgi:hypothetical protein
MKQQTFPGWDFELFPINGLTSSNQATLYHENSLILCRSAGLERGEHVEFSIVERSFYELKEQVGEPLKSS